MYDLKQVRRWWGYYSLLFLFDFFKVLNFVTQNVLEVFFVVFFHSFVKLLLLIWILFLKLLSVRFRFYLHFFNEILLY